MEIPPPALMDRTEIDMDRPFRSVKEAVAIFGERITAQKPNTTAADATTDSGAPAAAVAASASSVVASYSSSPASHVTQMQEYQMFSDTLQKLAVELEETKRELWLLKERESETEIALASLNAELHRNMSKMTEAEAAAAANAAAKKGEGGVQFEHARSLVPALRLGEKEGYFFVRKNQRKTMKKKPIIPLIGDFFAKKKNFVSHCNPSPCDPSQASLS